MGAQQTQVQYIVRPQQGQGQAGGHPVQMMDGQPVQIGQAVQSGGATQGQSGLPSGAVYQRMSPGVLPPHSSPQQLASPLSQHSGPTQPLASPLSQQSGPSPGPSPCGTPRMTPNTPVMSPHPPQMRPPTPVMSPHNSMSPVTPQMNSLAPGHTPEGMRPVMMTSIQAPQLPNAIHQPR